MIDYVLKCAHENQKNITIIYQKGLEITQRNVRILQITEEKIQCYCFEKKAIRNFKKDHILAALMLEGIQGKNSDNSNKKYR
ncbi:hypothetical protein Amet_3233 [Alkaliphilus metalliredigens QYMF]|uniref:WYL domain-containing protein n=1 Tax=Alkaliphilus metalliredigens (strain QYMF) TaxID=293826 RepID=A6TT53_ALKMQ|nr:hypothetical protein [Alkaliphilus metalliredigens]ABR49371.1 hypothetical protein Amet_3233 [Alkaliphilus metalliredigens QYMF]